MEGKGATTQPEDALIPASSLSNPLLSAGFRSFESEEKASVRCHSQLPEEGFIPERRIHDHPQGRPLLRTFFGDTPAPFECPFCSTSGITVVKSSLSTAAAMAAVVTVIGICFLAPGGSLWHKHHYCPGCSTKVGEFIKDDAFLVLDPMCWQRQSFAVLS